MKINRKKTLRLLKVLWHFVCLLLLAVSAAGIGSWWVWNYKGELVESLDETFVKGYVSKYDEEVDKALGLFRAGKSEEAEGILKGTLTELGEVRKRDRLVNQYVSALRGLLYIKRSRGDGEGEVVYASKLVELDENNYEFWREYGTALINSGKALEGIDGLYRAFRIRSDLIENTEPLAMALFRAGRVGEAREVVERYVEAGRVGHMQLFYAFKGEGGEGISNDRVSNIVPLTLTGTSQNLWFPLYKDGLEALRLDLPEYGFRTAHIESIKIVLTGGRTYEVPTDLGSGSVSGLARAGERGRYVLQGSDPYILIYLPDYLPDYLADHTLGEEDKGGPGTEVAGVRVVVRFTPDLSQNLQYILKASSGGSGPGRGGYL